METVLLFMVGVALLGFGSYYILKDKENPHLVLENKSFLPNQVLDTEKEILFVIKTIENKGVSFSIGTFKTDAYNKRILSQLKKKTFLYIDNEFHIEKGNILVKKHLGSDGKYHSVYVCGFVYKNKRDQKEILKDLSANP